MVGNLLGTDYRESRLDSKIYEEMSQLKDYRLMMMMMTTKMTMTMMMMMITTMTTTTMMMMVISLTGPSSPTG